MCSIHFYRSGSVAPIERLDENENPNFPCFIVAGGSDLVTWTVFEVGSEFFQESNLLVNAQTILPDVIINCICALQKEKNKSKTNGMKKLKCKRKLIFVLSPY